MNLLQDIITYIRRIIKIPNNTQITDSLIIDYINRFWIMDVDARMQLFDLKTKYQFQTAPGFDQYNMPMYSIQTEPEGEINYYPVYQGFVGPAYVNGVQVPLQTEKNYFFNIWPNIVQEMQAVAIGDGGATYNFTFPIAPNNTNPITTPFQYLLRGHIDITGIIAYANDTDLLQDPPIVTDFNTAIPVANTFPSVYITANGVDGSSIVVSDSGQFFLGFQNLGLLMDGGNPPTGNTGLSGGYLTQFNITGITQAAQAVLTVTSTFVIGQKVTITDVLGMTELNDNTYTIVAVTPTTVTIDVDSTGFTPYISGGVASSTHNFVNYFTGEVSVTFPQPVPPGVNINAQCYLFQCGLPRSILFYNNTLTFRSPPDRQYLVEIDAYLSPAAFLNSEHAIQFGYMCEYLARGAARKILSDTGDWDQFAAYEGLFREQELLVWKRSQRQWTASRTQTIYSQGINQGQSGFNNIGGSTL